MSFKNIKGQDRAVSFLENSIKNGRISHAYIFLGPCGVGKKLAALNFAKALNCQAEAGVRPCDSCVSCRKIDGSNHPDAIVLKPREAGSIGIDQVRAVIRDVGLKPHEAKRKVYIIDEADSMTQEASNALLKTLEEPVSESVLILISENLRALLQTIRSRAQIVRFFPLDSDEIEKILREGYGLKELDARVLSRFAFGRLSKALMYMSGDFFKKRAEIIDSLANKTLFDSDFEMVPKSELGTYLEVMLTWYRDILIAKARHDAETGLVNTDRKEAILAEAMRLEFDYLDRVVKQIILTSSFLDENANPKLAMSLLTLMTQEEVFEK